MKKYTVALIVIALIDIGLLSMGLLTLSDAKISTLAAGDDFLMNYSGQILVLLSVALAFFHKPAANVLIWLFHKMHRWLSLLLMSCVAGSEALMHILNIPHIEGWWLPMLEGGVIITIFTTAVAWAHKLGKKKENSPLA